MTTVFVITELSLDLRTVQGVVTPMLSVDALVTGIKNFDREKCLDHLISSFQGLDARS